MCVATFLTFFSTRFVSRQDLLVYNKATECFSNFKCSQGKRWLQNLRFTALIRFISPYISLRLIWLTSIHVYPLIGRRFFPRINVSDQIFYCFLQLKLYLQSNIVLNSSFSNSQNLSNSYTAKIVSRLVGQCRWWISSPGNFAHFPYIVSLAQTSPSAFNSQTNLVYGLSLDWGKIFDACLTLNQKIIRPYEYIWVLYLVKYIHEL